MITVFYDGACGLCSKEINYYRRIAPKGVFDWQDVTVSTAALDQQGIGLTDALMQLETRKNRSQYLLSYDSLMSWGILHESKRSIRFVRSS